MQWSVLGYLLFDALSDLCESPDDVWTLARRLDLSVNGREGAAGTEGVIATEGAIAFLIRECRAAGLLPNLVRGLSNPASPSTADRRLQTALFHYCATQTDRRALLTVDPTLWTDAWRALFRQGHLYHTREALARVATEPSSLRRIRDDVLAHIVVCGSDPHANLNWLESICAEFLSIPAIFVVPRTQQGTWDDRLQRSPIARAVRAAIEGYRDDSALMEVSAGAEGWLRDLWEPYSPAEGSGRPRRLRMLHLSDLHFSTCANPGSSMMGALEIDLAESLRLGKLDYVVLSGDIADTADPREYQAAEEWLKKIMERFSVPRERLVIVPGNHDVSWVESKKAYEGRRVSRTVECGRAYKRRFAAFASFYKRLTGATYPLEYGRQGILYRDDQNRVVFVGANSSWRIDHKKANRQRAGIHGEALDSALRGLPAADDQYLRVFVCHHPFVDADSPGGEFLELLARKRFEILLHGHTHSAKESPFRYDNRLRVLLLGAGTVNAPPSAQVPGSANQYHLLCLDPLLRTVRVVSRRREKRGGAWWADPRWGSADDPRPTRNFWLDHWQPLVGRRT